MNLKEKFLKFYEWSGTWSGTIVIVAFVIFFIAQAFVIPSGSMKNTLLIGDMLFVKKFAYGIPTPTIPWIEIPVMPDFDGDGHIINGDKPKRGDIVVFRYPGNPKVYYVKRCVAVGGDILFLRDKHLYIHPYEGNEFIKKHYKGFELEEYNGLLFVKDPYKKSHPGVHNDPRVTRESVPYQQLFDFYPIKVKEGEYFMMGDNRDHSNDSRFWGSVPYKYIVGTPWIIYFSWDENKNIRWDRVFKTPDELEKSHYVKMGANHKSGLY